MNLKHEFLLIFVTRGCTLRSYEIEDRGFCDAIVQLKLFQRKWLNMRKYVLINYMFLYHLCIYV